MANQSTVTPRVTNIAEAGLSTLKSAVGEEVKKVGQSAKGQVTGQYQNPQQTKKDQEIQKMEKQEEVFRENKGTLLEQKKQELVREHHREVKDWDKEMIQRDEQEKKQKLELQMQEEEQKKQEAANTALEQPVEIPGNAKQKKGGGLMGKIKKGFNLLQFKKTKSKESSKGQGVGG